MARAFALCVLLSTMVTAQPRVPPFLDAAALDPTLITPHLDARASAPVRIDANGRGLIKVIVTPKKRMHVYAADVDGFVPFTFKVAGPTTVTPGKVTYPVSETYIFPPTGESSRVYMKPFEVSQAFVVSTEARKVLAAGKRITGVGSVRYQACDDTVCYRPTSGSFVFEILQ